MSGRVPERDLMMNAGGNIMRAEDIIDADDDTAIQVVHDQSQPTDCDIWQGKRKVATVPAGGGEPILP
jgi:hypothetical protein